MNDYIGKIENGIKLKCISRNAGYRTRNINNIITLIPAGDLVKFFDVAVGKGPDDKNGYQRPPEPKRVSVLHDKIISKGIDLPLSMTINIREKSAFSNVKDGIFDYDSELHGPLWIVDGSHRAHALKQVFETLANDVDNENSEIYAELENLEIPVVLMFADLIDEYYVFKEINKHSKSVKEDVILSNNVRAMEQGDNEVQADIKEAGLTWEITGHRIASKIYKDPESVWYKRIKFAGDKKMLSPNVGINSMVKYMRCIVESGKAKAQKGHQFDWCVSNFEAYWTAISEVFSTCFGKNSNKYGIQKALGTDVLMRLWSEVNDWIDSNASSRVDYSDSETYKPAFEKIKAKLTDEDGSGEGNQVSGDDFWLAGKEGSVGNYAGEKGKDRLTRKLSNILFT